MSDRVLKIRPVRRGTRAGVATYAAAYRAGEAIVDERTGNLHKFSWREDVRHTEIALPSGYSGDPSFWARDRSALWNAAEHAERPRNARVAREYTVVLPSSLTHGERLRLTRGLAQFIADRYQIAVDFAIHEPRPGRATNHHAHLLTTTREVTQHGLGSKALLERQSPQYWKLGRAEQRQIRRFWIDRLQQSLDRSWVGRVREAFTPANPSNRNRPRRTAAVETSPLTWAEHDARARKQGVDVEELRRADRQKSRLTPTEQKLVQERRRAIRLRMEALEALKADKLNGIRRAKRAARTPEQVNTENRERRAREANRYQRPEVRKREQERMRQRYANRSEETVLQDVQRKRENYVQNAEKYRKLARERYHSNIEAVRVLRRARYRNRVAERLAVEKTRLERQAAQIQEQAVDQWREFRSKQAKQPARRVERQRDADYDYSR